jgi:hypothetical protein
VTDAPDPTDPDPALESSLPSRGARFLAFAAILLGGLCGGLIGFSVVDLQCEGSCGTNTAAGGLVGAACGALGVAVVAVLALRAMGEWKTIQQREASAGHDARQRDRNDSRRNPSA